MHAAQFEFRPQIDRDRPEPLIEQIEQAIIDAIRRRVLRPGARLPSIRQFARDYDVSTFTTANAYSRLVAKGWLESRPGSGYRVAQAKRPDPARALQQWQPPRLDRGWLLADIFADHSIPVKAGCGWLPAEWLSDLGLPDAFRALSRTKVNFLTGYGHPYGYAPFRDQIAAELHQHGLIAELDNIVTTRGATEALDLISRSLLQPGDTVVVESPCYANLLHMLRMANLRIVSVPRNAEGIDLDALEAAIQTHRPRALYVNTVLQNPTGTTLTPNNAFRLLKIVGKYDVLVIEDDISRELLPGSAPLLAAMDDLERVIYVGGYSKSVSPSMRVGYVIASKEIARRLVHTKMAVGLTSPEIMERLVLNVVRSPHYPEHLRQVRTRLANAHAKVAALMQQRNFEIFGQPGAGLFLWARPTGLRHWHGANAITREALNHGIWLAPGSYFDADDSDVMWLRFHVGYAHEPKLWAFFDRLLVGELTPDGVATPVRPG